MWIAIVDFPAPPFRANSATDRMKSILYAFVQSCMSGVTTASMKEMA
jgi:hypothetical protein